jgi:transcriptional regulator with XRE-family HTH domain
MNPELAAKLRAKKLGVLLKDARISAGKTMKECGQTVGISGSTISSYEQGTSSPSLPEVELLCHFLQVPLDRFWKDRIIFADNAYQEEGILQNFLDGRQRQIGNRLAEAREQSDTTYEEISAQTGISYGRMKRFEAGETPIPLPELELLCQTLHVELRDLRESESEIGRWLSAQSNISDFLALPIEIQEFVSKPVNYPYIVIAMNLSKMSAEELRAIAENLLEITI